MPDLPALTRSDALVVSQKKEWMEIFTDFETSNKYQVCTTDGREVMFAAERGRGGWGFFGRQYFGKRRPFEIEARDPAGQAVLSVRRPWTFWLSRVEVSDGEGRPLGSIHQRFSFLTRRYTVTDASGGGVAEISGPFWRPWTFFVRRQGQDIGKVSKKWSGLGKEMFTDADTFGVQFSAELSQSQKLLLVAATFLIDFVHFENSKKRKRRRD